MRQGHTPHPVSSKGGSVPSNIRHPKDFWTGIIFLVVGLAAVIIGRNYTMGTAGRMGPAYFPTILGGLLALIGLAAIVRAFFHQGEPIGKLAVKEAILVLASVLVFGFLIRGGGVLVAVFAIILVSGYASAQFKWRHAIPVAIGLSAFAVVVFIKLLGLPIDIIGPWFGA
jgi:hypothetical protein